MDLTKDLTNLDLVRPYASGPLRSQLYHRQYRRQFQRKLEKISRHYKTF